MEPSKILRINNPVHDKWIEVMREFISTNQAIHGLFILRIFEGSIYLFLFHNALLLINREAATDSLQVAFPVAVKRGCLN